MNAPFSIWSQYYNTRDPEDAFLEFKKDGLKYVELSYEHSAALLARSEDHIAVGNKFAEFLGDLGISVPQGHLAFPTAFCTDDSFIDKLVREIELFCAIGIKNAVLHCDYMANVEISYEKRRELNIVKLREIAEKIEHLDITLCLENLCRHTMSIDEILYIIDKVGSDKFGICLDTGHLNVNKSTSQRDFILKAGKYLKALHIHDNDGSGDQHLMPYGKGQIDFDEIVSALRTIDYEGLFNYEIPGESRIQNHNRMLHEKVKYVKSGYDYMMSK